MAKTSKKVKRVRWTKLILFLIIIIIISVALTFLFYNIFKDSEIKQIVVYDMKLEVGENIGFNIGNETLNFGTALPSGPSMRTILLLSDEPTMVEIFFEGELASWVTVSENSFIFEGEKRIEFTAVPPENAELGDYTGRAIIIFKEA